MKYFLVGIVALVFVFGKIQAASECGQAIAEACAALFEDVEDDDVDCGLATEGAECIGSIATQCDDLDEDELEAVEFMTAMIEGAAEALCEEEEGDNDYFDKRGRKRSFKRDLKKKAVKRALKRHLF